MNFHEMAHVSRYFKAVQSKKAKARQFLQVEEPKAVIYAEMKHLLWYHVRKILDQNEAFVLTTKKVRKTLQ